MKVGCLISISLFTLAAQVSHGQAVANEPSKIRKSAQLSSSIAAKQDTVGVINFDEIEVPRSQPLTSDAFSQMRMDVQNRIKGEELSLATEEYSGHLQSDFEMLNELLTSRPLQELLMENSILRKTNFRTLQVNPYPGNLALEVSYNSTVSKNCMNMQIEISPDGYKRIKELVDSTKLYIMVREEMILCSQIEPFPNIVLTEEYASHLHFIISEILNTYPKFQTSPTQYEAFEARKNLATLKDKIYFRIEFIKYCYARI